MVFPHVYLRTVREAFPPSCIRFTRQLSTQLIIPLFTKGDRQNPANYRPVSGTSIVCKILEHFINHHIITHFEENNIFMLVSVLATAKLYSHPIKYGQMDALLQHPI